MEILEREQQVIEYDFTKDFSPSDTTQLLLIIEVNMGQLSRITLISLPKLKNIDKFSCIFQGYGDSEVVLPDEVGVVQDTVSVIQWVMDNKGSSPVYVWGHSLGTG